MTRAPDPTPAPSRLTDRKRAAILDAAIAEFRATGYEATSMDRIAASAGVSKRTVYNHFPGKDALFAQILETMLERAHAQAHRPYRPDAPLRAQLLDVVRAKLRMIHEADFIDLARVALAACMHSPDLARDMMARLGTREAGLVTWIRAAADDGRLEIADPAFAATQLESLIKGVAFWPQLTLGQPPLGKARRNVVADEAVDMFLARYG